MVIPVLQESCVWRCASRRSKVGAVASPEITEGGAPSMGSSLLFGATHMADDYNDGRFRKDQIRDIVRKARQQLGIATERVFDLVKILSAGWINTVKGRKRLVLIVVPDDELGASDAKTKCAGDCVRIAVKRSVWTALVSVPEDDEALVKLRQAKFTLAHEYFHGVLWHDQAVMSRLSGELRASQKIKGLTR